jgi:hypothetical protein
LAAAYRAANKEPVKLTTKEKIKMKTSKAITMSVAAVVLFAGQSVWAANGSTVTMTCFPPPPLSGEDPGIGPPPPCLLPVGIASEFISPNPSGNATYTVKKDGTVTFNIQLNGMANNLVMTAWISYYFPGLEDPPDPIFAPTEGGVGIAAVSAPLAPISAAFSDGFSTDPNEFVADGDGSYKLKVTLDYNPFVSGTGPLRNGLENVTQAAAPSDSVAYQPVCCPDGIPAPGYDPIAAAYLRAFDPLTGYQLRDANGKPQLIYSPVPVAFIAIVAHVDKLTHGITPGIPIFPIPGTSVTTGDHFLVGMFDLRAFE